MLTVLAALAGLILLPLLVLHAVRRRQAHCGESPDPCFWCDRDCTYYNLHGTR